MLTISTPRRSCYSGSS
ncbi:hypothetical protein LINPERHAP2_LOCUS5017 [Linum perenne]